MRFEEQYQKILEETFLDKNVLPETIHDDISYMELAKRFKNGEKSLEPAIQDIVYEKARESGYGIGPVWHGTHFSFNEFDPGKIKSFNEGTGFYFTYSKDIAQRYGNTLPAMLHIDKPIAYDARAFSRKEISKIIYRIAELQAMKSNESIADGFLSNYGDVRSDGVSKVLDIAARSLAEEEHAIDQLSGIYNAGVSHEIMSKAVYDVTGHDGYVSKGFSNEGEDMIYVAWFPFQVKSAGPVTYDNSGNIIPLSRRFDTSKNDIRESKSF